MRGYRSRWNPGLVAPVAPLPGKAKTCSCSVVWVAMRLGAMRCNCAVQRCYAVSVVVAWCHVLGGGRLQHGTCGLAGCGTVQ